MKILCAALCAASAMLLLWGASARAATETVLYSFCIQQGCADGEYPYGDLLRVKDKLYATTTTGGGGNNGTVVSVDIATGAATVYAFDGNDGSSPYAGLINANGTLYGTTSEGGSGQNGTVFVLNRKNGKESVSYPFCSQDKCADGADPRGGLAILNGLFYGTTVNGGTGICNNYPACGVLYSLDPATGVETVLHSFCSQSSCADGGAPRASLIAVNGKLYGTTTEGGTGSGFCNDEVSGCGTVFDFDPATGTYNVLYSFSEAGGNLPAGDLAAVNGILYGTTEYGGAGDCNDGYNDGCGTIFSLDPATGTETLVYSFRNNGRDGANPLAGLVKLKGKLYGTTANGGAYHGGTVFSIALASGKEKVVYAFCALQRCDDGAAPSAGLIAVNGTLYGTTEAGGTGDPNYAIGGGTVFAITP